jgi:Sulfotransferase family
VKVLYILGRGRSGSTIFANVLGALDGYFSAGEVRYLWDPVVTASGCGCGRPVEGCPVWSRVLAATEGVDRERLAALHAEHIKESRLRSLLAESMTGPGELTEYAGGVARIYEAIAEVTGASVIIDSSKRPAYAASLLLAPGIDVYIVHFVRDPRASAYSWRSRNYRAGAGAGRAIARRGAVDATLRWSLLNRGAEAVLRAAGAGWGRRVRYEDFVAAPQAVTEETASWLGQVPDRSPFLDEATVEAGTNHTVEGNPSRFETGTLSIREEARWRGEQTFLDRWASTLVALPYLRRYGYPLIPPRR